MIMFYSILGLCLFFSLPYFIHVRASSYNRIYMFLVFVMLFVVLGFKSPYTTADSINYYHAFIAVNNGLSTYMEPGYVYLNKLIFLISSNPQAIFVVSGFIISFSITFLIFKQLNKYLWLAVFLYLTIGLFSYSFNMMRQILAVSFCIFSYQFILKRKFIPFALLVLLASSFHNSAWFFFISYFFPVLPLNKKTLIYFSMALACVIIFFDQISNLIFTVFPRYMSYANTEISGRLQFGGEMRPAAFIRFVMNLFILIFGLVCYQKFVVKNLANITIAEYRELKVLIYLAFASAIIMGFSLHAIVAERMIYYFWAFNIILIPKLIRYIDDKNLKNMIVVTLMICSLLYVVSMHIFAPRLIYFYNYHFCWEL